MTMNLSPVLACLVSLAACGGGGAKPATPGADPDRLMTQDEMVAFCVTLHSEVQSCAAEFTAMNVDLRATYSPEFAAMVSDPAQRQAIIEQGTQESLADAASAHERCVEFAQPSWGEPQPVGDTARLDACLAQPSCDAKMACLRPLVEPRFAFRARAGAGT